MLDLIGQLINGAPWAIMPDTLTVIRRVYSDHLAGMTPDIAAIEAAIGRPLKNDQPKTYEITDGVAVIKANGIIAKRMNLMMDYSGGISIEKLTAQFKEALADSSVTGIALVIDSPGGMIDGIFELANLIYESRDIKPIISLAYGTMASAAYLIGAAASRVYATDVAAIVGSIGVVTVHEDRSAKDASSGIVKTEIYRGKYKRIVTDGPLTEEGRLSLEERVDYYYSLFINDIASFRNVSPETVLLKMSTDVADSFIGQRAVEAGLIDGIASLDTTINKALTLSQDSIKQQGITLKSKKEVHMDKFTTLAELTAAYPDFAAQLRAEGAKTVDLENLRVLTLQEGETRILGLAELHFGKEAAEKFGAIINTGVSVEQYAAIIAINPPAGNTMPVSAEDKKKAELLAAIQGAGAGNPGAGTGGEENAKDFLSLVDEYMAANKVPRLIAMQAVIAKYPDKHSAYITEANKTRRPAHV
jgi:signal peptide peptidase SppA